MSNLALAIAPASEWQQFKQQATELVQSGLLPRAVNTPEKAMVIILKGRELGIPAMHALSHIHVVEGKPSMSAELMLNMIITRIPDARLKFIQNDSEACRIEASRKVMEKTSFGFSKADAHSAGLMTKDNWKKYTRAMLRSRAVSEMARSMFPDALCGVSYTPEELGGDVEVTESGEIVVTAEVVQEVPKVTPIKPKEEKKQQGGKHSDARWSQPFVDDPAAWKWLEDMFGSYYLSEDCRAPIRDVAVGKSLMELDQLAQLAATGHYDDK